MEIFNTISEMTSSAVDTAKEKLSGFFGKDEPSVGEEGTTQYVPVGLINRPVEGTSLDPYTSGEKNIRVTSGVNGPTPLLIKRGVTVPPILHYPLGLANSESDQCGPFMEITAFEYTRSTAGRLQASNKTYDQPNTQPVKIKFTVRLPLPGNLQERHSGKFEDHESMWNALAQVATDTTGAYGDVQDMIGKLMVGKTMQEVLDEGLLTSGLQILAPMAGAKLTGRASQGIPGAMRQASIEMGKSLNPMAETVYTAPNVMTHQFDITAVPKNEAEAEQIQKIIRLMRCHSTGKSMLNSTSLVLDYPVLFNINFFAADTITPIKSMLAVPDSFLESFDVAYSPVGMAARLMEDNSPVSYRISMSFRNTKAMLRDDIAFLEHAAWFTSPQQFAESVTPTYDLLRDGGINVRDIA